MKPMNHKTAGWLSFLFLFGACAFSMVSLFWGNLWYLAGGAICLIAGLYFLKNYMS